MKNSKILIPEIGQRVKFKNCVWTLESMNFGGKCRIRSGSKTLSDIDITELDLETTKTK